MNKHLTIKTLFFSTLGALMLLMMIALFSSPAEAQGTSIQGATAITAAPVQLAWWRGPGYYHRGYYWGPPRAVVCPRTCWRGYWGVVHCVRRCY